jgi:Rod binding protein
MDIAALTSGQAVDSAHAARAMSAGQNLTSGAGENSELREKFDTFVGESFYGQMLHEMRKSVGKTAYFNGGRAEEIFRGQLDQMLAGKMAKSNAKDFTGPMFELFNRTRS